MRKVLTSFEIFFPSSGLVGKLNHTGLSFLKQQLGLCIELDEQVPDY